MTTRVNSKADIKCLRRMCGAAERLVSLIDEAERRDIIGTWKGMNSAVSLRDDIIEFAAWHGRTLPEDS